MRSTRDLYQFPHSSSWSELDDTNPVVGPRCDGQTDGLSQLFLTPPSWRSALPCVLSVERNAWAISPAGTSTLTVSVRRGLMLLCPANRRAAMETVSARRTRTATFGQLNGRGNEKRVERKVGNLTLPPSLVLHTVQAALKARTLRNVMTFPPEHAFGCISRPVSPSFLSVPDTSSRAGVLALSIFEAFYTF